MFVDSLARLNIPYHTLPSNLKSSTAAYYASANPPPPPVQPPTAVLTYAQLAVTVIVSARLSQRTKSLVDAWPPQFLQKRKRRKVHFLSRSIDPASFSSCCCKKVPFLRHIITRSNFPNFFSRCLTSFLFLSSPLVFLLLSVSPFFASLFIHSSSFCLTLVPTSSPSRLDFLFFLSTPLNRHTLSTAISSLPALLSPPSCSCSP